MNSPVFFVLLAALAQAPPSPPPATADSLASAAAARMLLRAGVESTPDGALRWLGRLTSAGPELAPLDQALLELAHADFALRDAATRRLEQAPFIPPARLDAAIADGDAERRWRAEQVRDRSENRQAGLLAAALRQIVAAPPPDAVIGLIDALPLARHPDLQAEFLVAIRRLANPADRDRLAARLDSPSSAVRRAAAAGLSVLLPLDDPLWRRLQDDADDLVALEAARGRLDRQDRSALPPLVDRLDRPRLEIRSTAFGLLHSAVRLDFGYVPSDAPERRASALLAWRRWLASEASTAPLHLPVRWTPTGRGELGGRTLVCTGRRGRVLEFDADGRIVWRHAASAWSAEKLADGGVLIAGFEDRRIFAVDSLGRTVWEHAGIGAIRAKPLANGNLLVADYAGKRALEINRRQTIVWEHRTPEPCFDVERLPDGRTLFACANLIREITPDFDTVREWTVSGRVNGLQALPDGRLLVANFGGNHVAELDSLGRELWRFDEPQPSDAYRLPDGRTLVATASRIVEIDAQKRVVREWGAAAYGSARR